MIYYSETDTNILKESVNNYLGVIECIHNIENVEKGLWAYVHCCIVLPTQNKIYLST